MRSGDPALPRQRGRIWRSCAVFCPTLDDPPNSYGLLHHLCSGHSGCRKHRMQVSLDCASLLLVPPGSCTASLPMQQMTNQHP